MQQTAQRRHNKLNRSKVMQQINALEGDVANQIA
jgi:hypothetical protein